jgi:hypothetical protein
MEFLDGVVSDNEALLREPMYANDAIGGSGAKLLRKEIDAAKVIREKLMSMEVSEG